MSRPVDREMIKSDLNIPKNDVDCTFCSGTGVCDMCEGSGSIQDYSVGKDALKPCSHCSGSHVKTGRCTYCKGYGKENHPLNYQTELQHSRNSSYGYEHER